jgi:hypothetical protein
MKQFLTSRCAAIPDDQHMIQEQLAEGDKVVTRFKSTGTPSSGIHGYRAQRQAGYTNGALRNRGQHGPAVPLPRKLQAASRKAGACPLKGSTSPMTSRTRDRGTGRRAETAVFGRLFLQRMHHYRVLAKDRALSFREKPDVRWSIAGGFGGSATAQLPQASRLRGPTRPLLSPVRGSSRGALVKKEVRRFLPRILPRRTSVDSSTHPVVLGGMIFRNASSQFTPVVTSPRSSRVQLPSRR